LYFDDVCVGMVDRPEMATAIVEAMNTPRTAKPEQGEQGVPCRICREHNAEVCSRCYDQDTASAFEAGEERGAHGLEAMPKPPPATTAEPVRRRDAVPALPDERVAVLADRAGGQCIGAPATRDEERAMADEIQAHRARLRTEAPEPRDAAGRTRFDI